MIRSYLKVAIRNVLKYKFFSIINVFGLTMGIASCLFVMMYIHDELNYDRIHEKGERMYRMNIHGKFSGQEIYATSTCLPMSRALVDEIPEVEESVRLSDQGELAFRYGEKAFSEEYIFAADSNFFEFFSFNLLSGNPHTVLNAPNQIVISQDLAWKYFEDESPLDKTLSVGDDRTEYVVTGVMDNIPGNSHLKFNAVLSSASFPWMNQNNWLSNSVWTYYILQKGVSPETIDKKLEPIMERNVTPVLKEFMGKSLAEFREDGGIYEYFSMAVYDIHLMSDLPDEPEPPGDMSYVIIMAAIGLFILVIACINFMNLTTAKSAARTKEVGLRKMLGSRRNTLMVQFLTEAMMYAFLAAAMAVATVYILLPWFNLLSGKSLSLEILQDPALLFISVGIVLLVGVLAGSYPALYLTSFQVTDTLKGKYGSRMKSGSIRNLLVTFQFWVSIVLMICTAVVFQQLRFIQNVNLGIDKEHILMLEATNRLDRNKGPFRNQLLTHPGVIAASYSDNMVPGVNSTKIFRSAGNDQDHIMATYSADVAHLQALGFEMVSGRFFSVDFPSDSGAVVLNEAAVRELGWSDPLEEKLLRFNDTVPVPMEVIGVMKDFNFESLKVKVRPLVLQPTIEGDILYVRFSGESPQNIIDVASEQWKTFIPGEPFQYSFLDEDFDALFRAERRLGRVFTVFTIIAIFVACLGLFGLAAFVAEQKTKEIGVRKVMGASVWGITTRMSKEFARLVMLAFVLAVYPAYYFMDRWLEEFANRVELSIWVFVLTGIVAIVIAGVTVSYQSLKAARVNPVNSLRYE